jgi:peptidoglycan/LPS O-acetylase OafA/YrhL
LDAFAALGRVSYEAYLFHVALIIALKPAILSLWGFVGAPPLATQLANAVSLLLLIYWFSSMLSRYVTEPLNSRIRRFYRAG